MFVIQAGQLIAETRMRRDVAVAGNVLEEQPSSQHVLDDWASDIARDAEAVVVLDVGLGLGAKGEGRPLGVDLHHAGDGVLAEQGALRAFQHFYVAELAQGIEADSVSWP